jgi:hypothetical protein
MATPAVNHPAGSSRMIPGGRLTHLASTPPIDGDTTMDSENSFISATSGYAEEAVDESLVVDSETSFVRSSSDPFLVSLPPIVGDLEGSEDESYSDGEATELEGEEVIERVSARTPKCVGVADFEQVSSVLRVHDRLAAGHSTRRKAA